MPEDIAPAQFLGFDYEIRKKVRTGFSLVGKEKSRGKNHNPAAPAKGLAEMPAWDTQAIPSCAARGNPASKRAVSAELFSGCR
jgi:hypothetical protein